MKWESATNEQLETTFNNDNDCPNGLLVGVVAEMMVRGMFEGMIISIAKRLLANYSRDEIIQAAHIGIYQLAKIFKPKRLSFKQMVYIAIERRLKSIQQVKYQKKNFMNQQALNYEVPEMVSFSNVEKAVLTKLTFQEQLNKLTKKERHIVEKFIQGYSIAYIAMNDYRQDPKAIHYHFNKALKKMGIENFKIGARSGLKGA